MFALIPALLLVQLLVPLVAVPQPSVADPAFTLTMPPVRPEMVQGGSTSFLLFIQSSETASFSVRIEGVPSSVVADPQRVGRGRSTIVLRCSSDTPTGTYAIQVTASARKGQQTQTFALDIKPAGPQK